MIPVPNAVLLGLGISWLFAAVVFRGERFYSVGLLLGAQTLITIGLFL